MKAYELEMDGIKYFVKVKDNTEYLHTNTFNSHPVYTEEHYYINESRYSKKDAKKLIKRALAYDPKSE